MLKIMLGNYPGIADRSRLLTQIDGDIDVFCWPPYGAFFPPQGRAPDPRTTTIEAGSHMAGWQCPDLYISWATECRPFPADLYSSGVPVAVQIGDWNLSARLIHMFSGTGLPLICDSLGTRVLRWTGLRLIEAFPWGWDPSLWLLVDPAAERDIDVLFVGSRNDAIHRERERLIVELASLSDEFNILLRTWTPTDEYQRLAARSKVIVNKSVRGETNMRNFEAIASGCRLLNEADNNTLPHIFEPGVDYGIYHSGNLYTAIKRELADSERISKAIRAQAKLHALTYDALIARFLEDNLDSLLANAKPLPSPELLIGQWLHTNDLACVDLTLYTSLRDRAFARVVGNSLFQKTTKVDAGDSYESTSEQQDIYCTSAADWLAYAELAFADGRLVDADRAAENATLAHDLGDLATLPVPDFSWWRMDLERRLITGVNPTDRARQWLEARALYLRYCATGQRRHLIRIYDLSLIPDVPDLLIYLADCFNDESDLQTRLELLARANSISPRHVGASIRYATLLRDLGRDAEAQTVVYCNQLAQQGLT